MKTAESGKSKGSTRQKKQFAALGLLSAVLVVVLVLQLRQGEAEYEVAALSQDAVNAVPDPAEEEASLPAEPVAQDNPVLSGPPAEIELERNPFTSFWSQEANGGATAASVPPPSVVLGITIPGGERPVAVIDGQLRFVGDLVQGWTLEAVRPRAIVLRSPTREEFVVEMPVFRRELTALPASAPPGSDG